MTRNETMNHTKLLSDLQMVCSCVYEIKNKEHVKKVGGRLEDIIAEHFRYLKPVTTNLKIKPTIL